MTVMVDRAGRIVRCAFFRRKHLMEITSIKDGLIWKQCSRRGCDVYDFTIRRDRVAGPSVER